MIERIRSHFCGALLLGGVLTLVGCDSTNQPSQEVLSYRDSLILDNAPADALTLDQAAEKWPMEETTITLTGRVYAEGQDPWDPNQASLMLSILPDQGHDDPEHADNCPFCKRKAAKAPKAVVMFQDAQGNTIPISAKTLFDLERGDLATVRGKVTAFDLNVFTVIADGIHLSQRR